MLFRHQHQCFNFYFFLNYGSYSKSPRGKGTKTVKDELSNELDSFLKRGLVRVLSNFVYLLTMFALFVYLGPILALVLAHLNST